MGRSSQADTLLSELVEKYGPEVVSYHRWFDERERWLELVHAVVSRCSPKSEHIIRDALRDLATTGLLDSPLMFTDPEARAAIIAALERRGIERDGAQRGVGAVTEIANVLVRKFGGKTQIYLRHCVELLARMIREDLPVSSISETEMDQAVRFWMQNVMNAPFSMNNQSASSFLDQRGVTWHQLVAAADRADLNIALLDDIVEIAASDPR